MNPVVWSRCRSWLTRGALWAVVLASAVVFAGCCGGGGGDAEPSRWEEPADEGGDKGAGEADKDDKSEKLDKDAVVDGSKFNGAFPDDGTQNATRTFTQEKTGYAEAKYDVDGKEVVKISISDTGNNPSARKKFSSASDKVSSYPMVTQGKRSSVVLVADRFQVKASSKTLSPEERRTWLSQVKFSKLARLK